MNAPKGNILIYPPIRPELPYIAVRFAGHGVTMAGVAKSEEAARAMLVAHEQAAAKASKPEKPE